MAWRTATLACCSLLGCGPGLEESVQGRYRVLEGFLPAGRDGTIRVDVIPEAAETTLLAVATPVDPSQFVHVRSFELPEGHGYDAGEETSGDRQRSNAGFLGEVAVLNWPITQNDPALQPGRVHRLEVGLASQAAGYTAGWAQVTLFLADGDDPRTGTLAIDLVHLGVVGTTPAWRSATSAAVEHWRSLYREIGLELEVSERILPAPDIGLPNGDDATFWRYVAASGPPNQVRVVISPDRVGDPQEIVGASGGIPAALSPTGRTGVRVSAERICGVDGDCSAADIRFFGEIMAHEVGHHLGLFHPVESDYASWDALSDTVECGDATSCESALGGNLMFPYTVCTLAVCIPQDAITAQQDDVLQRYIAVD